MGLTGGICSFLGKVRRAILRVILGRDWKILNDNVKKLIQMQNETISILYKIAPNIENLEADKQGYIKQSVQHLSEFRNSSMVRNLNEKSLCIDLGANIGDVTEVFLECGGEVYSFEPHPLAFGILSSRFSHNPRAHLFNVAVSDHKGKEKLFYSKNDRFDAVHWSRSASIYASKSNIDTNNYHEVGTIDFSEFIKKLDRGIEILKMDIEGAEYSVLENLIEKELYKRFKYILVETHERMIPEIENSSKRVRQMIIDRNIGNISFDWI